MCFYVQQKLQISNKFTINLLQVLFLLGNSLWMLFTEVFRLNGASLKSSPISENYCNFPDVIIDAYSCRNISDFLERILICFFFNFVNEYPYFKNEFKRAGHQFSEGSTNKSNFLAGIFHIEYAKVTNFNKKLRIEKDRCLMTPNSLTRNHIPVVKRC